MNVVKAIAINSLARFATVRRVLSRFHDTGIQDRSELAAEAYEVLAGFAPVAGKDVLELGPGQTLKVLEMARRDGARSVSSADIVGYFDPADASARGVDYRVYDGGELPFSDASMDLIWAYYVMQHVRHPAETVREIRRVLRPGGALVCRMDLRDHYHHHEKAQWYSCMQHSERLWRMMAWNRGSYVNRLLYSQWLTLLDSEGLTTRSTRPHTDAEALELNRRHPYLAPFDDMDLLTYRFDGIFEKTA